jgi:hypothetical protein
MLIYIKFAWYTSWMHYMHQVEHNLATSNWNLPTSHQETIHTKEHTNTYTYVQLHTFTCIYIPIHLRYIPIHLHTYQYTRVPKHTRPPISAPRALMGQLYFLYALSAVGNTAPESGRPKEARLWAATRNVASLWSIGPESMKVPVGGLPVLAHGPWATRSWCQQCDTYIRGPKGTSDRLERTQRPALRSQVAKVCIITYL